MAVGTGSISLQDVVDEIESIDGVDVLPLNSLLTVFNSNYNNSDGFDSNFAVAGSDRLSEFQNYDHDAVAVTYTIGLSGIPATSEAVPAAATGETFTVTFNVGPDPNSVVGGVTFVAVDSGTSWASFPNGGNTNLTDGDTFDITIAANSLTGAPRAIDIRVASSSNGVTNSPRLYRYYQKEGRNYGGGN